MNAGVGVGIVCAYNYAYCIGVMAPAQEWSYTYSAICSIKNTCIHAHYLICGYVDIALAFYYIFDSKPAIDLYNLLCVRKYCVLYNHSKYAFNACWCISLVL